MSKKPSYVLKPSTAVLTRGFDPALSVGSARPAIFRSSTYVFSTPEAAERAFAVALGRVEASEGESCELIYSRLSHPNAEILEDQIVPLEVGSKSSTVFNSGLAAISTVFFTFCRPGGKIIFTTPLYGGTQHLLEQLFVPYGVTPVPVPAGNTQALTRAIVETPDLQLVLIETPSNPILTMTDIEEAVEAAAARKDRPLVAVDNTFLGPVFQHPLKHGADLVIYSATKYLAGFSDMLGGVVLAEKPELIAQLKGARAILGNILQPDECWLLDTRIPTVSLRMNRQSKSAQRIAEKLADHPAIETIHYPSLFNDPEQIAIRDKQCSFPGGMIAFCVRGGKSEAFDVIRKLELFKNAVSLGGMESLCCHPASTTHSEMSKEDQMANGVTDNLIRISIGTEHWKDLLQDITQALG